ncbi:peptidoglycan DD-metalloendopeptidase family protein [Alteromonadaceae bacterium BrNp21-10]|nr:peptidoglycan DD-metalloendopeptidase family protein [Alteromonadaceae bacterium BrNp21-10]
MDIVRHYFQFLLTLMSIVAVASCAGRSTPAPVANVSSTIELFDNKAPIQPDEYYKVIEGDTLFSIAWFYGIDYQDLARINNIQAPFYIRTGQKISLKPAPSQLVKGRQQDSPPKTRPTIKIKANQPVDRPKKQAYGKYTRTVNDDISNNSQTQNDTEINWSWPAKGELIGEFSNAEQGNKGIDIANTAGTSIFASADGKVVYTGNALRGYGNLVIIKHSESYLTAYAHNSKILVKEQQWIKAGQEIAQMGKSDSDRVKLHFEVRFKGKSVDPLHFLPHQ